MHIFAGIGLFLFPLLHLWSFDFWELVVYTPKEAVIGFMTLIAHVLLFPLAYVLYKELSADAPPLSAGVALLSLVSPVGIALEVFGVIGSLAVLRIIWIGLSLWMGLTGYLAVLSRRLPRRWAFFCIGVGLLGVTLAAAHIITIGPVADISGFITVGILELYLVAMVIWSIWTGVMVIRWARIVDTGA